MGEAYFSSQPCFLEKDAISGSLAERLLSCVASGVDGFTGIRRPAQEETRSDLPLSLVLHK